MNSIEKKMVALLEELKDNYHVVAVKAEFEAEGTRIVEAMRLKDVASAAGLPLNIKIGGAEAITDMRDAMHLGAERIIGPMIETPYALQKFLRASQMVFGEKLEDIEVLSNIETITAFDNFSDMLSIPEIACLSGIVIGRVDFVGSTGWGRSAVNSDQMLKCCVELAKKAKEKDIQVLVGGGVSTDSKPFLNAVAEHRLDRFETRKIIFDAKGAIHNPEIAFIKAVEFELLWLKNKRDYYQHIAAEDNARIEMMEARHADALKRLSTCAA